MKNVCEKYMHFYLSHILLFTMFNICIVHNGEKRKALMTMKIHMCLSLI